MKLKEIIILTIFMAGILLAGSDSDDFMFIWGNNVFNK
jgi:hypothetical protein